MRDMSGSESAEVRRVLRQVLPTAHDFMAFIQDEFPEVMKRVTDQMDGLARESLLLQLATPFQIYDALRRWCPDRYAGYQLQQGINEAPSRSAGSIEHSEDSAPGYDHHDPLIHVDRTSQFAFVRGFAARRRHEVILVPGSSDQAHSYFLARINLAAPTAPARVVRSVEWPRSQAVSPTRHPSGKKEILAALATALGGKMPDDIGPLLSKHLQSHHLLLLHPPVDRGLGEKTLRAYYTEYLPELVESQRGLYKAIFIQPVAWNRLGFVRRLFNRTTQATKKQAREFLGLLAKEQSRSLPIESVEELADIKTDDILTFLKQIGWPNSGSTEEKDRDRRAFAAEVMAGSVCSEIILKRISDRMRDDQ